MGSPPYWLLDSFLVLLLLGAFAGAARLAIVEVSLLRVRPSRVSIDAAQGDRRSQVLLELLDELPLVLNTVLFVVLLCQVTVAAIASYLAQRWIGGVWVTIGSILVTLLLFVYAESIPKTLAVRAPRERALRSARALRVLVRIWKPILAFLLGLARLHSGERDADADAVTERELRFLARQSAHAGAIEIRDAELVDRSFVFGDQVVGDVMVGREHIVAIPASVSVDVALHVAIAAGHRRLPVVGRGLDDVVGVVRLRDLAAAQGRGNVASVAELQDPLFCRPDDSIARLIERMRASTTWLAIVRNEKAVTVGLATVEDIVAELMGEIEEQPVVNRPFGNRGRPI